MCVIINIIIDTKLSKGLFNQKTITFSGFYEMWPSVRTEKKYSIGRQVRCDDYASLLATGEHSHPYTLHQGLEEETGDIAYGRPLTLHVQGLEFNLGMPKILC
jgi:hypothetical protein